MSYDDSDDSYSVDFQQQNLRPLMGDRDPSLVAWSPDERYLAFTTQATTLFPKLLLIRTDTWQRVFGPVFSELAFGLAFSRDAQYLAVGRRHVGTTVYRMHTWEELATFLIVPSDATYDHSITFSESYVAVAGGRRVEVFEIETWNHVATIDFDPDGTTACSFHPDESVMVVSHNSTSIFPSEFKWSIVETENWTIDTTNHFASGGGSGFSSRRWNIAVGAQFSPEGDFFTVLRRRGTWTSSDVRVWSYPALDQVYIDTRSEGNITASIYADWAPDNRHYIHGRGSSNAPAHLNRRVPEFTSGFFGLTGNRGGLIKFAPGSFRVEGVLP